MTGVVLISHGGLAEGIISSASMLAPNTSQVASVTLWPEDNPDDFRKKLEDKVKEVDTGDGVFILADMLGGTPSNQAMYLIGEKVRMLAGLNLTMLYTLLLSREDTTDLDELVSEVMEAAQNATVYVNDLMKQP